MQSRWSDNEARQTVARYPEQPEALALRVYTSRLIGADPDLVLHGGGNTSVKLEGRDLFGDPVPVLHVKGSGWSLATIEPEGLPAVRLEPLRRLRALDALDDETMVAELRRNLLEGGAPTPSVETLLHAFLPHPFIDHSHADAVLAITNQRNGEAIVRQLYGDRVAFVPYVMPGLELAKRATEIFEKSPDVEGLVLARHGLFTFGDDARSSYERHVEIVERAERHLREAVEGRRILDARPVVALREAEEIAPIVRGALAEPTGDPDLPVRRWILEHRSSEEILHVAAAAEAPMLVSLPPITPDHVIRTKGPYLFLGDPPYADLQALSDRLRAAVEEYRRAYGAYVARNLQQKGISRTPLDPTPRVVLLPGLGLFACGRTTRDARIAADIAEHTLRVKAWAQMIGQYDPISESDLFDMEYWSLEQAKLGRASPPPLGGQVAVITGGAGAIGEGIARKLVAAGAEVALVDMDEERLGRMAARLPDTACATFVADVADEDAMADAFRAVARRFGGADIVVAAAGIAEAGDLVNVETDPFDETMRVNARGTFLTVREALRHLTLQGTGGHIVIVSSKNVFAPGASFGAYSAAKAAAHQVGRIAALEGAPHGVRVNMINADAVFGSDQNPSSLWESVGPQRAAARGLSPEELPEYYRHRNLLKARVTAEHVGNAVVFFAGQGTPTTGAVLPVDGGIPEAFPR